MSNLSTDPPTINNPTGKIMVLVTALTLPIPTITVFLRIWGRYRYKKPRGGSERNSWVFWSDLAILVAWASLVALSAVLFLGVHWGEGLHMTQLSPYQKKRYLQTYWLYSVFYKWGAGISKMATCFLYLAIATPNMKRFNITCMAVAAYVLGYSVACSIGTVLQCGTDVRANWDKTLDQSHCFYMPPFWYTHGALNLISLIITGVLPWWLFSEVTFKRKYFVASLMTVVMVGELIPAVYRLYGLYMSSQHLNDISYITTTGIFVSQIEVELGVTAACIPTVWKIFEEFVSWIRVDVLGFSPTSTKGSSYLHDSELNNVSKSNGRSRRLYTQFEDDDMDDTPVFSKTSERFIAKEDSEGQIIVNTTYAISSRKVDEEDNGGVSRGRRDSTPHSATFVKSIKRTSDMV